MEPVRLHNRTVGFAAGVHFRATEGRLARDRRSGWAAVGSRSGCVCCKQSVVPSRLSVGRSGRNRPAEDVSVVFPLPAGAARRPPHPERRRPAVVDAVQSRGATDRQQPVDPFDQPFIARAVIPLCNRHPGCYDSDVVRMFDHRPHRGRRSRGVGMLAGEATGNVARLRLPTAQSRDFLRVVPTEDGARGRILVAKRRDVDGTPAVVCYLYLWRGWIYP